ncbi:hypothetical protein ACFFU1_16695 [Algibacter miyuki]|uniref:Uncharacterized protein n=1 Tax=Algibacter miyuki TaxID=1306933 RepID=A0ABV5H3T9_9FLAO|nr:hypothetical protein [Algibacter miyuki]MDN3665618.1 hypothetical protein [Algibacter miyuki]
MNQELSIFNSLKLSQEEFETIENLAATNYAPSDIALYLDVDKQLFLQEFHNPASSVRHHYNKGCLVASFEKDNKMLENAKGGNITAYQESNKSAAKRAFENHKQRILNES